MKKQFSKSKLLSSIVDLTKRQAVATLEWIHIYDGREVFLHPDGSYRLLRYSGEPYNFAFDIIIPELWTQG